MKFKSNQFAFVPYFFVAVWYH